MCIRYCNRITVYRLYHSLINKLNIQKKMEANERLINAVRNGPFIGSSDIHSLPRIPRNGSSAKRKILVQQSKSVSQRKNVPVVGQEYDYRRTPDSMKSGARRVVQGSVRPQLPADTRVVDETMLGNQSAAPFRVRNKLIERLNVARCPTPMPGDDDIDAVRLNYPNNPLESSRSAWDGGLVTARTNLCTDGGDLANLENDADNLTLRHPNNSKHHVVQNKNKLTGKSLKYDVIASDMDREYDAVTSASASTLDLTENVIHYYFQRSMDKDKRIVNWLADCEEKSKSSNQLPAHLPDILASRRNITLIVEDV